MSALSEERYHVGCVQLQWWWGSRRCVL